MTMMKAAMRLCLTAAKDRLVPEGDPEAAFLYAAVGDFIPADAVERFGLVDGCLPPEILVDHEAEQAAKAAALAAAEQQAHDEAEAAARAAAEQQAADEADAAAKEAAAGSDKEAKRGKTKGDKPEAEG